MRDQPGDYTYPPNILSVVEKPGREWSREEYISIVAWLFDETQLRKLLTLCLFSLGSTATAQDAEDAWMEFCEKRLEKVSKLYDLARGSWYWSYLCFCLKRDCGHLQSPLKKIADQEIPLEETYVTEDGEVVFELGSTSDQDPIAKSEFRNSLNKALLRLSQPYQDAFILVKIEDRSYDEASKILSISKGLVRIRVHRAIQKLRSNEKLSAYIDKVKQIEEKK